MSKESFIGGDYIETTGGSAKVYAKGNIENSSLKHFAQKGDDKGVIYTKNEESPVIEGLVSGLTYIIVVGTQNHRSDASVKKPWNLVRDVGEGSKLMFVHQALRRMKLNKGIKYNFVLCTSGYSSNQKRAISQAVKNLEGIYLEVTNAQQVINIINTGDKNNSSKISEKRKNEKIQQLLFYSHGGCGGNIFGFSTCRI